MKYKIGKQLALMAAIFCLVSTHNSFAYEAEINELSATMAKKISETKKEKIAAVDFTDLQGDVTELGRFIAEELSVALAGAGKGFKVVDRTHLKSIIKEHKLSETGAINPDTARKLGKIAGVQALVTGTLTPFGDSVRISVKILDTATAEVIEADRKNIAKTQAIEELLARGISARTASNSGSKPSFTKRKTPTTKAKGYVFELQFCKKSDDRGLTSLSCSFFVTSKGEDRKLTIKLKGYSWMIDDLGNKYLANHLTFGGRTTTSQHIDSRITNNLSADVPIRAVFTFKNISSKANGLSMLEIRANNMRVQFHDISF